MQKSFAHQVFQDLLSDSFFYNEQNANGDPTAEVTIAEGMIAKNPDLVLGIATSSARALANSVGSNVETLYKLMDGKAEALEFNAKEDSKVIEIELKDLAIKDNILIGGIIRDRKTIIPGGNDMILAGDKVIVIAANHRLQDLSDILEK